MRPDRPPAQSPPPETKPAQSETAPAARPTSTEYRPPSPLLRDRLDFRDFRSSSEHFSFAASPLPPRLRISRHQPPQRCRQTRRRAPQLIVMMQRQLSQHPFALRRQRQQHLAPVVLRPFPLHVPPTLKPVNQFHRAVMLNV